MATVQKLVSFPYYFRHWLRNLEVTPKVVEEMKRRTRCAPSSSFHEDKDTFSCLETRTLQSVVSPFLFCFLEVELGDLEEAEVTLGYINEMLLYLAEMEFMQDYMEGVNFLSRLLNHHFMMVSTEFSSEEQEPDFNFDQLVQEYKLLKPISRMIILIARWMLNESISERCEEAVENLREIIQIDPTNWFWHYLLCSRLRFVRRVVLYSVYANPSTWSPWPEEVEEAVKAVNYSSHTLQQYQLMSTASLSQCLAEIVRAKNDARYFGSITLAGKEYQNLDDVVTQIKDAACEALMEIVGGFAEYIRYGEIFGIILPAHYRDYMLAAACMKTACVLAPGNSKANQKMGTLILNWKKDSKRAMRYFKAAIRDEPHSFPAWIDLFPSMLCNFKENEKDFESLFQYVKNSESQWTPYQRGTFAFYEGCVEFLSRREEGAIHLWLKSISLGDFDGFKILERNKVRCAWPEDHALKYEAVLDAIDSFVGMPEQEQELFHLRGIVGNAQGNALIFMQQQRRNSERKGNHVGSTREYQRQERQSRFRTASTTNDADADTSWRRSSGGEVFDYSPSQQF